MYFDNVVCLEILKCQVVLHIIKDLFCKYFLFISFVIQHRRCKEQLVENNLFTLRKFEIQTNCLSKRTCFQRWFD